jgi:hypothetical protein
MGELTVSSLVLVVILLYLGWESAMLARKNPRQLSCCTRVARWCWTASNAEARPGLVSHQRADQVLRAFQSYTSGSTVVSALVNRQIPLGTTTQQPPVGMPFRVRVATVEAA